MHKHGKSHLPCDSEVTHSATPTSHLHGGQVWLGGQCGEIFRGQAWLAGANNVFCPHADYVGTIGAEASDIGHVGVLHIWCLNYIWKNIMSVFFLSM